MSVLQHASRKSPSNCFFFFACSEYLLYLHHENGGVAQMVRAQDS